ncbi:ABC transporter permease [Kitasatospora sp. NBC_01560]|uniref:ABC transporter permease n=1 Tax=Kitasatospora sp. NBC_01560 TaxID=2975965 RepID=UPI0038667AD5
MTIAAPAPVTPAAPRATATATAAAGPAPLPSPVRLGLARGLFEVRLLIRNREAVLFSILMPIMLLVIFASLFDQVVPGTGIKMREVTVAGMIGSTIMSSALGTMGIGIAVDRHEGTLRRLAGTPFPLVSYFIGKVVLILAQAVVQVAVILALGVAMFGFQLPRDAAHWFTFLWVFLLGTVSTALIGITIGSLARSARNAPALVNFPYIGLQFISGVFWVITALPKPVQIVASLFPLKWMTQGIRSAFLPESFATAEPAGAWEHGRIALVLTAWLIGGLALCWVTFRRNARRF